MKVNKKLNSWIFITNGCELPYVFEKSKGFSSVFIEKKVLPANFYDTFDGALFNKNIMILRFCDEFQVFSPKSTKYALWFFSKEDKHFKPVNISDPALYKILEPASVRALLPVLSVNAEIEDIELKNEDGKTIAGCRKYVLSDKMNIFSFLVIEPVKGFKDETKKFVKLLKSFGMKRSEGKILEEAQKRFPEIGRFYSNKMQTELKPDMFSSAAIANFMLELLGKMRDNIPGVINDYDSEFLHDYRVSCRRARSILNSTKGVFDKTKTSYISSKLKHFVKVTNYLRDIDVYLLKIPEFRSELSSKLVLGLDNVEEYLKSLRKAEFERVCSFFESIELKDGLTEISDFFTYDYTNFPGNLSGQSIKYVAADAINDSVQKIIKRSDKFDSLSPAFLHKLRIEFKKLRYLIEAFGVVIYGKKSEKLLKNLKKLQDSIGVYHDYHMHILMLHNIVNEMPEMCSTTEDAVGKLNSVFEKRQKKLKGIISEQLEDFTGMKNIKEYLIKG